MLNKTPKKPYAEFPLFPHGNGQWAKKIKGKQHYFGLWSNPDAALAKYLDQRDDLQAGRIPRTTPDDTRGLTIRELANRFLSAKKLMVENGELTQRMWSDYHGACERLIDALGRTRLVSDLRSDDFEKLRATFSKGVGMQTLTNRVRMTRTVFKWGYESELIANPMRFGPQFKLPAKKLLRAERNKRPPRMFEASELRTVIETANIPMRAMVLLAINCAFGNTDVAKIEKATLDLVSGWADYPRQKTAVMRRCPLWPETIAAVDNAIEARPAHRQPEDADLVFITKHGRAFVRSSQTSNGVHLDFVGKEMAKLLKESKIDRAGLNFYAIRHTFETIAGATRDQIAVSAIMGHAPHASDMSAVYRERIDDDRLKAVSDHVRAWLWTETMTATATNKTTTVAAKEG